MVAWQASCRCGQLTATCAGEPVRVSVCHCHTCQRRSGSPFGAQARWSADRVTIAGEATCWVRTADSGRDVTYHFCPTCGTTLWYQGGPMPDAIAIPVGLFADAAFPAPGFSVWEARKHPWVAILGDEVEHHD